MGHVNPQLLQEFVQFINIPLFTNGKKAEELLFNYDKNTEKIGLFIDGVLVQYIQHEVWARFSAQTIRPVFLQVFFKKKEIWPQPEFLL